MPRIVPTAKDTALLISRQQRAASKLFNLDDPAAADAEYASRMVNELAASIQREQRSGTVHHALVGASS